jgi:hypothetical protein
LWIRIDFRALRIRIQLFYLDAIPDPGAESQTNADPDPGETLNLKLQKVDFLHEKYTVLKIGKRSKTSQRRYESPFEIQETRNGTGFRTAKSLRIRIDNTMCFFLFAYN